VPLPLRMLFQKPPLKSQVKSEMKIRSRSYSFLQWLIVLAAFAVPLAPLAMTAAYADDRSPVMKAFQVEAPAVSEAVTDSAQKDKHKILFAMGATLLLLVIATAALGVAMALFGKEVFVAHMITAGLTVFLAIAHAVVSMVWFFPY